MFLDFLYHAHNNNKKVHSAVYQSQPVGVGDDITDLLHHWAKIDPRTDREKILHMNGFKNIEQIMHAYKEKSNQLSDNDPQMASISSAESDSQGVQGYLNILSNFVIVSALFLSVLYELTVSPITPSSQSLEFFGHTVVAVFKYIYFICVSFALHSSILIIILCSKCNKILGLWLPPRGQVEFVKRVPINDLLAPVIRMIISVVISIPLRSVVVIDPLSGLISFLFVIYFIVSLKKMNYLDDMGILILHGFVKAQFENKNDHYPVDKEIST